MMRALRVLFLAAFVLASAAVRAGALPRPDHVVIVIEENHAYGQIIGSPEAPYINALAKRGMLFTRSYGVAHPSQPNYLALFSGSTHGYSSDVCPISVSGDNLAGLLAEKRLTFATYSESQPVRGDLSCAAGAYRRKHNPAANWSGLQDTLLPFRDFPRDFAKLPTVSLVIPDLRHDMHDGSIAAGDAWLKANIEPYAQWAAAHNSLLIVTWDEDDSAHDNRIATLFLGARVRRGSSAQRIDHYAVLRTLEDMYGLRRINESAHAKPVSGAWRAPGAAKK
jgi:phospholipase C